MPTHEDTLAQLYQGVESCTNIHNAIQHAHSMAANLSDVLRNSLGGTGAYDEVGGYSESVLTQLELSAQTVEQTRHAIETLMLRFDIVY
ncbi:hypothetical protein [Saccharomonospora piscinae]|uniref:Uncharacterized protein n=1 Tax=Saccharomonospora piscinae TaxID=687388 RepID=A0A1V9A1G1_SACPI|nr:hypothetical protein [Saccharomonospora piscinae]OQO90890.1 hypothetical protein B1813_15340 [Saccharomonospora piscinae]TLW93578.1 hypothetical protein FFT09_09380 [Saccharomonospora piscinae]